ncbi:hypothetical protein ACFL6U_06940 [Planctomycetota bacterium]
MVSLSVLTVLTVAAFTFALANPVDAGSLSTEALVPSAGNPGGEYDVPISLLERIADQHAHDLWGEDIAQGPPLPMVDVDGRLKAYVFPYIRGSQQFPDNDTLFESVHNARQLYNEQRAKGGDGTESFPAYFTRTADQYGSIYVSVTRRNLPILRVDHFLHPYFVNGILAQQEAQRLLTSQDIKLNHLQWASPFAEYFEFIGMDGRVLIDMYSLSSEESGIVVMSAPLDGYSEARDTLVKKSWELQDQRIYQTDEHVFFASETLKYVADFPMVPPLLWTLNCATTSKAMVLGYYDHYVPGTGTILGFGRLIDYWYEHPSNGNNVPNLIEEVHAANKTDVWNVNDYAYEWTEIPATVQNDWAWQAYTNEIDNDRPAPWSFIGHTNAGIGYRMNASGKWALVYNTWSTQISEYPHSDCIGIARIIPKGGSNGDHQVILAPNGGETYPASTPAEIAWYDWGSRINQTDLYYSGDAGLNWTKLDSHVPSEEGENTYRWIPGPNVPKVRIRVEAYAGNDYIAGDGSFENFSTQPQDFKGTWVKIFDPVGMVVAGYNKVKQEKMLYASDLATGDIYQFMGKAGIHWNWIKVGGPAKQMVLDAQGKLYSLSPDGKGVYKYNGTPMQWTQIGHAAGSIYPDVNGVCATNPDNGDVYRYLGSPFSWLRIGGPGKTFVSDAKGYIYALSPDGSDIWRYDGLYGPAVPWEKIGGAAANIFARGLGVYATNPDTGDVYFYHGKPFRWTRIGGPAKSFSVDVEGRLYGLATDNGSIWRHEASVNEPAYWGHIGGAAANIYAGRREIFATSPQTKNLMMHIPQPPQ